ncbi:MAG: YoaK family protein [Chthoniobacteraceae bacterium]
MLAIAVGNADWLATLHFAAVIGSFVAGTTLSGFIIQDSTLKLDHRYGVALLLESALLIIAIPLLKQNWNSGLYAAAGACGLQNAMATTYSGTVIRTTHVSGMFTDLGIFLGHFLRGLPIDVRRLRMCLLVISAFLLWGNCRRDDLSCHRFFHALYSRDHHSDGCLQLLHLSGDEIEMNVPAICTQIPYKYF